MNTRELQIALKTLGFDPGEIDGIPGRRTTSAVRAFQRAHLPGSAGTGTVGPKTIAKLLELGGIPHGASDVPPLPWVEEAERFLGLKEVAGPGNNRTIMGWADDPHSGFDGYGSDATPWCGLFVSHCIGSTLPEEPLPTVPVRALAWQTWGVDAGGWYVGAVATKSRKGGGHVFIVTGFDPATDRVEGINGNVDDSVCYASFPRSTLNPPRWPATAALPTILATGRSRGAAGARSEA